MAKGLSLAYYFPIGGEERTVFSRTLMQKWNANTHPEFELDLLTPFPHINLRPHGSS